MYSFIYFTVLSKASAMDVLQFEYELQNMETFLNIFIHSFSCDFVLKQNNGCFAICNWSF